mgnify:CR=1 FL=1
MINERINNLVASINEMLTVAYADQPIKKQVRVSFGKRYAKLIDVYNGADRSAYGFVDLTNGNVLMPASWTAPTKNGARSNVLDADYGLSGCDEYGVVYKNKRYV